MFHREGFADMGIDLNTIEEESEEKDAGGGGGGDGGVCMELWHACAGPLISLPKKGSLVVYFPQGHLELIGGGDGSRRRYDMPPNIFCRVVDVTLHAELVTDEIYARLSLVAESGEFERRIQDGDLGRVDGEGEEVDCLKKSATPQMFCKTLTASDTSTHGGFSVPRRAAEDSFPALDYKQQRPSQELIAKDLHGVEWRFRHIYRGQPRRHLLTTGWSAFVNKKKLVSGDAILFLRGNDGVLRLGVRRAVQVQSNVSYSLLYWKSLNHGTISAVSDALARKSVFSIDYNPRSYSSEFIIPYWKFKKGLNLSFSIGTRFKMRFESDDASERRYTGLITGIGDADPIGWPGSKWRCLTVRWDDGADNYRQNRLSPWEIEPIGSFSSSDSPGSKRAKMSHSLANVDFPVLSVTGCHSLEESARLQVVLQGQEMGTKTPYRGIGATDPQISEMANHQFLAIKRCISKPDVLAASESSRALLGDSCFPYNSMGSGDSFRFHKVLQGQEKPPIPPPCQGGPLNLQMGLGGCGVGGHSSAVGTMGSAPARRYIASPAQVSSPSSVLMFQQTGSQIFSPSSMYGANNQNSNCSKGGFLDSVGAYDRKSMEPVLEIKDKKLPAGGSSFRLFGFPLVQGASRAIEPVDSPSGSGSTDTNSEASLSPNLETTTEHVQRCANDGKKGRIAGRAIDLSKLAGYEDLIGTLERLFDMEGLLNDPRSGWHILYTDGLSNVLHIGEDTWQEFCNVASKILIYTQKQVQMMSSRSLIGDARCCLNGAAFSVDIARFSSDSNTQLSI